MEKEKAINERQERVFNLRRGVPNIKQRLVAAIQNKRRAEITNAELKKYEGTAEQPRAVFMAMGRMYVKRPLGELIDVMNKDSTANQTVIDKSKEDMSRLDEMIKTEEATLRREVNEFTAAARAGGFLEGDNTAAAPQITAKKK